MSKLELRESVTEAPKKRGNRWRVIVARPGQGSSGFYSEAVLRRDAEKIIAPGGQMFINHGADRNPKDMVGIYPEGSFWDEDEKAVVSEVDVFSHWKEFVEEVGPHCGASLYALGESDEDGNVTAILEDRLNGADLVARPGLIGSGLAEKLYESAVAHSEEKPTVTVAEEHKEIKMDQELKDALTGISNTLAALVADKKNEESAQAQVAADEAVAQARVESFAAAVKAVDEADLFESQRESILESAKAGEDVAPLIEAAKKVKAEAIAALTEAAPQEPVGRILGESASKFGAWS